MLRFIRYSDDIKEIFPELEVYCICVHGVKKNANFTTYINENIIDAKNNINYYNKESNIPSIINWRSAYRRVKTDPTKFRNAAESLLRKLRISGSLSQDLHPLVMLCNSFSAKYAIPIAVLDVDQINEYLEVRFAQGNEIYTDFSKSQFTLPKNEISFFDKNNIAHARKWSHKQNSISVIKDHTKKAVIIIESLTPLLNNNTSPSIIDDISSILSKEWPDSHSEFFRVV